MRIDEKAFDQIQKKMTRSVLSSYPGGGKWTRAFVEAYEAAKCDQTLLSDPPMVSLMVGAQAIAGALAERGVDLANELPLAKSCAEAWGLRWK